MGVASALYGFFCYGVERVVVVYGQCSEDSGFVCNSRKRQWHVAVDKRVGKFVRHPAVVYKRLMEALSDLEVKIPDAFWVEDEGILMKEKKLVKKRSKATDSL